MFAFSLIYCIYNCLILSFSVISRCTKFLRIMEDHRGTQTSKGFYTKHITALL